MARATPETTLWFWNSELGWATVHPLLAEHGWEYRSCHIWDKGLGHIAGNANTRTLRKFPVITEVCAQYVKAPRFRSVAGETLSMQNWLRSEWRRSGLPFRLANDACGVANAATRKYLTAGHLWYYPPPDAFVRLANFANEHGDPSGKPYFSQDGHRPITAEQWARMRAKFQCPAGVTNVWRQPQVAGKQRINGDRQQMQWKYKSLHGSQKPLELIETTILATTDAGDTVWEPFGGLCPAAICAFRLGRASHSAEIVSEFYHAAVGRLLGSSRTSLPVRQFSFDRFVESALYCARKRNHYWLYERQVRGDAGTITSPSGVSPYPMSKSNISDKPSPDGGGNFGRLARYGLMDDYIAEMQSTLVRGITVRDWQAFFKAHLS